MKTTLVKILAVLAAASLTGPQATSSAQDAVTTNAPAPAVVTVPALNLSPGALQVLQLVQAKVGDGTILAFVKGSQDNYYLTAPAIIFLRQQGVSDAVLTAMLTPPAPVAATNPSPTQATVPQPTPAPVPETTDTTATQTADTTVVEAPATTYVETPPDEPTVIYQPVYTPYYYPPVFYSIGGYGGYGGYHGGGYGGYHGGGPGGYHGGGSGGGHVGGNLGGGNNGGRGGLGGNGGGYGAPHR